MKKTWMALTLAAAVAAAWTATAGGEENRELPKPKSTRMVLSYRARAENKLYELDRLRGKVVVVTFCARWCPICNRQLPELAKVTKHLEDQPVVFVFVNTQPGDSGEDIYQHAVKHGGEDFGNCLWAQDADGITQKIFGQRVSQKGTLWQAMLMTPDGGIQQSYSALSYIPPGEGMSFERSALRRDVEHLLPGAKFVLGELPSEEPLKTLARRFEWGDYSVVPMIKTLMSRSKYKKEATAAYEGIMAFADGETARAAEMEKLGYRAEAYRIYARFAGREFTGSKANREAKARMAALRNDKEVKALEFLEKAYSLLSSGSSAQAKPGRMLLEQVAAQFKDTDAGKIAEYVK
ncbi:MAG: TlpA family protein disulfide reductase [Planctomycetes bacterium]|nr:TlpA family protein disulfide reductase [Planctomycetota bacterium]